MGGGGGRGGSWEPFHQALWSRLPAEPPSAQPFRTSYHESQSLDPEPQADITHRQFISKGIFRIKHQKDKKHSLSSAHRPGRAGVPLPGRRVWVVPRAQGCLVTSSHTQARVGQVCIESSGGAEATNPHIGGMRVWATVDKVGGWVESNGR